MEVLGPVTMKAFGKYSIGEIPKDAHLKFPISYMPKILGFMLKGIFGKKNFNQYFAEDIVLLQPFINDQLVTIDEQHIHVLSTGKLLIRNICMCFDIYLRNKARQQQFSRVI